MIGNDCRDVLQSSSGEKDLFMKRIIEGTKEDLKVMPLRLTRLRETFDIPLRDSYKSIRRQFSPGLPPYGRKIQETMSHEGW